MPQEYDFDYDDDDDAGMDDDLGDVENQYYKAKCSPTLPRLSSLPSAADPS
jgi:hypothetical protein